VSEPEAYTETVDAIDEFAEESGGGIPEGVLGEAGDEPLDEPVDEAADEPVDEAADEPPADDTPGIPDEPATFAEEIRAQADLPETGDARVDEVLARLGGIENQPTSEHVAVYDEVHRGLQDALANLDQG
jgi:hypothetical protein